MSDTDGRQPVRPLFQRPEIWAESILQAHINQGARFWAKFLPPAILVDVVLECNHPRDVTVHIHCGPWTSQQQDAGLFERLTDRANSERYRCCDILINVNLIWRFHTIEETDREDDSSVRSYVYGISFDLIIWQGIHGAECWLDRAGRSSINARIGRWSGTAGCGLK